MPQPSSSPPPCLRHSQKPTGGVEGQTRSLNQQSCSHVLTPVHQSPAMNVHLITQLDKHLPEVCRDKRFCQCKMGINHHILLIHTSRSGGAGCSRFCSQPWESADTQEFLSQETSDEAGGARHWQIRSRGFLNYSFRFIPTRSSLANSLQFWKVKKSWNIMVD